MHRFCFYLDWAGWPPEAWAAWTQAILSAAAIYAASRLATRQDRVTMRRRADACVGLITHAQDELIEVVVQPLSRTSLTRIEALARQLADVPMDSAPDFRLVVAVRQASSVVSVLAAELVELATPQLAPPLEPSTVARRGVREAHKQLEAAYVMAIEAANELQSPTLKQRYKAWTFNRNAPKE